MINTNDKYLKAICHALGLPGDAGGISPDKTARALLWAAGKNSGHKLEPYRPVALQPVLATLANGKALKWFPPVALSLTDEFFPKPEKPAQVALGNQFDALKTALASATENNRLTCLQFHASTLAVSEELADLPLYDFIKTASAILHCLENGNGKLRLAGGSISGIQSYLYDIVSKRAGKLLKGRSFYLQLLSDSLVKAFLEKFGLSDCHVVYSSGGGFYVLIPDTEKTEDDFEDYESNVIKKIYATHKTNLFCEFAMSDAFDETGKIEGRNGIWDALITQLGVAKNQRLSHNKEFLSDLLGYVDEGGDDLLDEKFTRDTVTNEQILRAEAEEFDEDGNLVHPFTNAQKFLGERLRAAKFLISSKTDFDKKCFPDSLDNFHLLSDQIPNNLPSDSRIFQINAPNANSPFILYGGYKIPFFEEDIIIGEDQFKAGSPKTFDQLATGDNLDKLGILRMDVDGLGKIFSEDIGSPLRLPATLRSAARLIGFSKVISIRFTKIFLIAPSSSILVVTTFSSSGAGSKH